MGEPKLGMDSKVIEVLVQQCTGCRSCELVCSFRHFGEFNPLMSRIRVASNQDRCLSVPNVCLQCESPACMEACPVEAISYRKELGAMVVDPEVCNGCEACVGACPYHAMRFDATVEIAFMCELCHGDPECVKVCFAGALRLVSRAETDQLERAVYEKWLENGSFWMSD